MEYIDQMIFNNEQLAFEIISVKYLLNVNSRHLLFDRQLFVLKALFRQYHLYCVCFTSHINSLFVYLISVVVTMKFAYILCGRRHIIGKPVFYRCFCHDNSVFTKFEGT